MDKSKALWALFLLLPLKETLLFFSNQAITKYQSVTGYLKRGDKLPKGISESDFKALLHSNKILTLNKTNGCESLHTSRLQGLLEQFGMQISPGSTRMFQDSGKSQFFHTFVIESRLSAMPTRRPKRKSQENKALDDDWDYYNECRNVIRACKKEYDVETRKISDRTRNLQTRNVRARTATPTKSPHPARTVSPLPEIQHNLQRDMEMERLKNEVERLSAKNSLLSANNANVSNMCSRLEQSAFNLTIENEILSKKQIELEKMNNNLSKKQIEFEQMNDDLLKTINIQEERREAPLAVAEALDFEDTDRDHPVDLSTIPLSNRLLATFNEKALISVRAIGWGYETAKSRIERLRILNAARRMIYYTSGLPEPPTTTRYIESFITLFLNAMKIGNGNEWPTENKSRDRKTKVQKIQDEDPELLHNVWRYAEQTIGKKASFSRFIEVMNLKLESMGKDFTLTKHNAITFFKQCKGTLKREKYVPLLTKEKKEKRVAWCNWMQDKLNNIKVGFNCCYIDEKWFYPSSGRCMEKNLPLANFETDSNTHVPNTALVSRRYIIKVMFMGIIAPPALRIQRWLGMLRRGWMNGKIGLHRVSEEEYLSRMVRNQKFADNSRVNETIKQGAWKDIYANDPSICIDDFLDDIAEFFELDDEISEKLCLSYDTLARIHMTTKHLNRFKDGREELLIGREVKMADGSKRPLTINDMKLSVMYEQGDKRQKDCSCDTTYMKKIMPIVGNEIRDYFFWLNNSEPIYLIIDNAGGHGTNVAVEEYRKMLQDEFNIILKHQVPNSPETNLLDLGVWRALQSRVEKISFQHRFDSDVLAGSVQEAWEEFPVETIGKVYKKWLRVLELIKLDDGGNRYVEQLRGSLTNDPTATKADKDAAFAAAIEKIRERKKKEAAGATAIPSSTASVPSSDPSVQPSSNPSPKNLLYYFHKTKIRDEM